MAEEFVGKDFRRSRNSHSTPQDPLFTESKATTWTGLCRKPGVLVGSCYSCSAAEKCGGGEFVWEILIPLLCLNQGRFCGVSSLTARFLRNKRFLCTRALHRRVFERIFAKKPNKKASCCRQNKCCYHRAMKRRCSVARVVASLCRSHNL